MQNLYRCHIDKQLSSKYYIRPFKAWVFTIFFFLIISTAAQIPIAKPENDLFFTQSPFTGYLLML